VITPTTASAAYALVGPEWTNVSGTAYYDQYCGSTVTVYAYVVLQYSWGSNGSMGGCLSSKSKPHIVFAGSAKEAGSVRVVQSAGLDTLDGVWDTIENSSCCVHHDVSGELPSVSFAVGEQGHRAQPRTKNGPKFLLTRLIGVGAVSIGNGHTVQTNDGDAVESTINDGRGTVHFRKWRVFEHGVIDEDRLVLRVEEGGSYLEAVDGHDAIVHYVGVVVTKAERDETDACPVGATGLLTMGEIKSGTSAGNDYISLTIPHCHVLETFRNGRKSAKVAVGLTRNTP
jgi:hypothetical protein